MQKRFYALGRLKAGEMNRTEMKYKLHLDNMILSKHILWYKFEGLKFRLADKTFYTPDFTVMNFSNEIELHEVKGFWTDDAKVKIKVASAMYPFRFKSVHLQKDGWLYEEF